MRNFQSKNGERDESEEQISGYIIRSPAVAVFLSVAFVALSSSFPERECGLNLPWRVPRGMWAFFLIMLAQPRVEVARDPAVIRFLVSFADEDVNVVESVHQTA